MLDLGGLIKRMRMQLIPDSLLFRKKSRGLGITMRLTVIPMDQVLKIQPHSVQGKGNAKAFTILSLLFLKRAGADGIYSQLIII